MPSQPEAVLPHPEAELPQPDVDPPVRRPRGRPRKPNAFAGDGGLTREAIIQKATELARAEPLDEISIVRLAQAFGVVPGLIRYHVGSRDDLLTGVLNLYFRERMASVPKITGDWRADVMAFARATMASMLRYPGIAQYIARHNRFRLFQKVDVGEVDYGLEFFNQFACVLMQGGLSRKAVAAGYHLLMLFLVASSNSEIGRMEPGRHEQFIKTRVEGLDKTRFRGALYMAKEFAQLDSHKTFEAGLSMLVDGIAGLR